MPDIKLKPGDEQRINLRNPAALAAYMRGDIENAIAASTPGGIAAQEKAGQTMLVKSNQLLPKLIIGLNSPTREQVTAGTGIVFLEDHDDLFVKVQLPPGWQIIPTEHDMWSSLVDAKSIERAGIFYKAAFYDRKADMTFCWRYVAQCDYAKPVSTAFVKDLATGRILYTAGTCPANLVDERDKLWAKADAWLREQYPDCKNPFAYW